MKIILFALLFFTAICNAESFSVLSPDGRNRADIEIVDATLSISVFRDGKLRMGPVSPAIEIQGKGGMGEFTEMKTSALSGQAKAKVYKKSKVDLSANVATFHFKNPISFEVVLRNDAIAYRFVTKYQDDVVKVISEKADVVLPSDGEETYISKEWPGPMTKKDVFQNSWEFPHEKMEIKDLKKSSLVCLPLIVKYKDSQVMAVSEANLFDYPGWNLKRRQSETSCLRGAFAKMPDSAKLRNDLTHIWVDGRKDYLVQTKGSRTYPWRVFMFADEPVKLCENDAVWALSDPEKGDFSWVEPGLAAWDFWCDRVLRGNLDFTPGTNTETFKHFIDFAAEHSLKYYVIDAGWAHKDDLTNTVKSVDLKDVLKHANKKNVKVILWAGWGAFFNGGVDLRELVFKHYSQMGVAGFKIDFFDRDDAEVERFLASTAELAQKYKLVLLYHGMHKPTGLTRTYPNVLNYEGVFGLEQVKWPVPGYDFAKTDLSVFFCRMTAGPVDYTPGAMRNATKKTYRPSYATPESMTTRVHQMALYTLYEAPLQMLSDSPTMYRENLECTKFIRDVPTVWDETVGLVGQMDKFAVVARRKGANWWVGAIGERQPVEVEIKLDFLSEGSWSADVFEDGPLASGYDASDYRHKTQFVKSGEVMKLKIAGGGGWTAKFTPAK